MSEINNMRPQLFTFYEIIDGVVIRKIKGTSDFSKDKKFCCNICYEVLGKTNIITKINRQTGIYYRHDNTTKINNNSNVYCSKILTNDYEKSPFFNQFGDDFKNTIHYALDSNINLTISYENNCCLTEKEETLKNRNSVEVFDTHIIFDNVFLSFKADIECNNEYTYLYCSKHSFIKYLLNWKNKNNTSLKVIYINKYQNRMCNDCINEKKEYLSNLSDNVKDLVPDYFLEYLPTFKLEYVLKYFNQYLSQEKMSYIKKIEKKEDCNILTYSYNHEYWFFNSDIVKLVKQLLNEDGIECETDNTYYNHLSIINAINNFRNGSRASIVLLGTFICNILNIISSFNFIYRSDKFKYDFLVQYCIYKFKSNTTDKKLIKADNRFIDSIKYCNFDETLTCSRNKVLLCDLYLSKRSLITKNWNLYNYWIKTEKKYIPIQRPIQISIKKPVVQPKYPSLYNKLEEQLAKTIKNLSPDDIVVSNRDKLKMFINLTEDTYNYTIFTTYKNDIENIETNILNQMIDYCKIPKSNNIFIILHKLRVPTSSNKEVIIKKLTDMITW